EVPGYDDFSVGLERDRIDLIIWAGADTKSEINTAIRVQSANPIARYAADSRKPAANENLPIRLYQNWEHVRVWPSSGIESGIEAAVVIETCDPTPWHTVITCE